MDISQSFIIKILLIGIIGLVLERIFSTCSKKYDFMREPTYFEIINVEQNRNDSEIMLNNSNLDILFPKSIQVRAQIGNYKNANLFFLSSIILGITGLFFAPFSFYMTFLFSFLIALLGFVIMIILSSNKLEKASSVPNGFNQNFLVYFLVDVTITIKENSIQIQGNNHQIYKTIDCQSIEKIRTNGFYFIVYFIDSFNNKVNVLENHRNSEIEFSLRNILGRIFHENKEVMIQFAKINNIPIQNDYEE
jgi:hypothetical protein